MDEGGDGVAPAADSCSHKFKVVWGEERQWKRKEGKGRILTSVTFLFFVQTKQDIMDTNKIK
jgi:hypothetical protein